MAIGINYHINESINKDLDGSEISSCNDDWTSLLCVPQDRLEDIKFHKDFNNDLISVSDLFVPSPKLKSTAYWNEVSSHDIQSSLEDIFSTCEFPEKSMRKQETGEKEFEARESNKERVIKGSNDGDEKQSRFGIAKKCRSKRSRENSRIVNDHPNKIRWDLTKRNCYHCQTESTPQWRIGPKGPKTLCNACGVRYKAGKLLPEYRPVASPTFDGKKHSNFHKRVLQRRFGNMNLVRFR